MEQRMRNTMEEHSGRYSRGPVIALLQRLLDRRAGWGEIAETVTDLWQGIAEAEAAEEKQRPWLRPGALEPLDLSAKDDADPLTARERAVRDVLAKLDEDVQWYLGDEEGMTDDAFMNEELRKLVRQALDELRKLK
jgi:hypothetical protein